MAARKDEDFLQAIAGVAKLGGFTLKGVSTADDFETRTVTVKFTRISDGHVQEAFDWERESVQAATIDANGHVEKVSTLQPGDLAETQAQADAEITESEPLLADPDDAGDVTASTLAATSNSAAGRGRRS